MQNVLISILLFVNLFFLNKNEKSENDRRIFGKWKITNVTIQDSPNGDFQNHLKKQNITLDSATNTLKSVYEGLIFKFEPEEKLIIYKSDQKSVLEHKKFRLLKTENINELKLEMAGPEGFVGKPYELNFVNDQKIILTFPEGKVLTIFSLNKLK